ncbi:MAG TPA: FtsK/SpoIIIE domain-containing protein, partial [Pirellulaceae bacterium]|nr:FtsK/SpoIIIE domain-containing protein [Pirellulaceae bacterium]
MPNQPITLERQRELIDRLTHLAARRATEGADAAERDQARAAGARQQYQQVRDQAITEFERQHAALVAEYKAGRESILSRYESEGYALAQEEEKFSGRAAQEMVDSIADAKTLRQHRTKEILRAYREQKNVPRREYAAFKQRSVSAEHEVNALVTKAQNAVRHRCPWPANSPPHPPRVPGQSRQQYIEHFTASLRQAYDRLAALQNLPTARFIEDGWPWLIFLGSLLIAAYLSWLLLGAFGPGAVIAATFFSAVIAAVGAWQAALPFARKQTLKIVPEFQQAVGEAYANLAAAMVAAKTAGEEAHQRVVEQRDADLTAAKAEYKRRRKEAKADNLKRTKTAEEEFAAKRKTIEDKYERRLDQLEKKFPDEIEKIEHDFTRIMAELRGGLAQRLVESRQQREHDQRELTAAWASALAEFQQAVAAMNGLCDQHFARWESIDARSWKPPGKGSRESAVGKREAEDANGQPAEIVSTLRFGHFGFQLPVDENAEGKPEAYELPAVLSYPECPSLLLEAEGEGREAATQVIQNVMLRLLTTFPPGKVRFTIIDPVGLGQNFSAFMHLADYDEKLVSSRIWTEGAHIHQRLADLTEHMENVIQKYLRNEFASIQEYNQHAGEVAEPFQILVIANFPANFSEEAARRLASIATSGARCGVYTLISADTKLALPRNFDLADIEAQAATLVWDLGERRFRW